MSVRATEAETTAANIPQLTVTKRGDHSNFSHSVHIKWVSFMEQWQAIHWLTFVFAGNHVTNQHR